MAGLAVDFGLKEMRDLIRTSPAADLLLPLTTALDRELGEEPRVPREVGEVAEDIRRDLAERRSSKHREAASVHVNDGKLVLDTSVERVNQVGRRSMPLSGPPVQGRCGPACGKTVCPSAAVLC